MKKAAMKLFPILLLAFLAAPPARADDADADEVPLPEGVIVAASGMELGEVEDVELADDAEYAAVEDMDVAGAMLGMPFEDIRALFFKTKNLYAPRAKNSIIYTIASDWRYNLDYECRRQGTVVPDKLEKCVLSLARARGLLYPSELHLERKSTGETISIYFTSNATNNVVWKVVYNNDVNELEGAGVKFENQREKKILAFIRLRLF